MGKVFANGSGDIGSVSGRVIPKTFKMVLDTSLHNTQHFKVLSRVKWGNLGRRVAPSSTPQCSSYWKWSFLLALDYGRQLFFFIFTEIQTVTVTGNGLDSLVSFIEPVTIHNIREGPCSDVMGYITITDYDSDIRYFLFEKRQIRVSRNTFEI